MSMYFLDERSLAKFQEMVRWFDANVGGTVGGGTSEPLADSLVPFELSAKPEQNDDGVWFAKGKQLYFKAENGYEINAAVNDHEAEIYFPLSADQPVYTQGERLFCVYRGRWEAFEGGGEPTPAALSGVVVEAIAPGRAGRVRIYGRNYPTTDSDGNPIEPVYDLIICDELAVAQNEFPEQLLPGTVLADIRGPFRRPKQGGNDNETESYYVAVNTEGVYTGILATDVTGPDAESTVQIRDRNGNLTTMTIHSYYIAGVQTIGAGTGVMVARQQTDGGLRLVIVKSRYAVTLTEPPT